MNVPDWIGKFFENRGWLGLVQYSSTNGLNVAGTRIDYETVTYAQFTAGGFDLNTARHVVVSDRHSTRDASDLCGSLWWIEPTNATGYKRVLRSPPIYCATSANLPSASTFKNGRAYQADLGPEGCDMRSDGTGWIPAQNSVIYRNNTRVAVVSPNSTFGTPTVGDAGGYVQLTGAGNHLLTQAACVTAGTCYLYISTGTEWTPGLYQIRSVTDGGAVLTLELAYNGSYGSPTVANVSSGIDLVTHTITLPRLRATSKVALDVSHTFVNSAANKNFKIKLDGTVLYDPLLAGIGVTNRGIYSFLNRTVSSQIGGTGNTAYSGISSSFADPNTATIDTSTGTAQVTLSYTPTAANEVAVIEAVDVVIS